MTTTSPKMFLDPPPGHEGPYFVFNPMWLERSHTLEQSALTEIRKRVPSMPIDELRERATRHFEYFLCDDALGRSTRWLSPADILFAQTLLQRVDIDDLGELANQARELIADAPVGACQ